MEPEIIIKSHVLNKFVVITELVPYGKILIKFITTAYTSSNMNNIETCEGSYLRTALASHIRICSNLIESEEKE